MTPRHRALLAAALIMLAGLKLIGSCAAPHRAGPDSLGICRAVDGDTLRCGDERIRLLGIDAPELPGHCRRGRVCAPGDADASRDSLAAMMTPQLGIVRIGQDRYGRTLALVDSHGEDLSCWQLRHRQAIYKQRWDNDRRVAMRCPSVVRDAER